MAVFASIFETQGDVGEDGVTVDSPGAVYTISFEFDTEDRVKKGVDLLLIGLVLISRVFRESEGPVLAGSSHPPGVEVNGWFTSHTSPSRNLSYDGCS